MLMLIHRTRALNHNVRGHSRTSANKHSDAPGSMAPNLVEELAKGIRLVLDALKNYSMAFEALQGMHEQVGAALEAALR